MVVTGPNLAREIAERQPSASVVASVSLATAEAFQTVCHTARFRAYTNTDVIGCELGGATKNVIALAVGMAMGLGLGANATASVITRGLAEISRLGLALGADPYTFSGWRVSAILSRRAHLRCPGTGPSVRSSEEDAPSPRSPPRPGRSLRA